TGAELQPEAPELRPLLVGDVCAIRLRRRPRVKLFRSPCDTSSSRDVHGGVHVLFSQTHAPERGSVQWAADQEEDKYVRTFQ
ncbi:hypothetical protein XENORESO_003577, partial [Xenotaenia resolanae]